MGDHEQQLSQSAIPKIRSALAGLSDEQADRVAVLLAERGPLAGVLNPLWEGRAPYTRDEVEALVVAVFNQHVLDATEPEREESDLAVLFQTVTEAKRKG